jgi:hypothetical protein
MGKRAWSMVVASAVLAAGGFVAMTYGAGTAGGAAAETVHNRMFYGPDFRPLDFRIAAQFVQNTGGGIYAHLRPGTSTWPTDVYVEAAVDLPVGAQVTSVSFFYKDCGVGLKPWFGAYYFGAYKPSSGVFTYLLPVAHHAYGNCAARYTFTRTGAPIATVTSDRRYVLGALAYEGAGGNVPHPDPLWLLYGARVKYTCPTTCT